jgi:hypothetical protein
VLCGFRVGLRSAAAQKWATGEGSWPLGHMEKSGPGKQARVNWSRPRRGEKGREGNGGPTGPNPARKIKMAQGQFWV